MIDNDPILLKLALVLRRSMNNCYSEFH